MRSGESVGENTFFAPSQTMSSPLEEELENDDFEIIHGSTLAMNDSLNTTEQQPQHCESSNNGRVVSGAVASSQQDNISDSVDVCDASSVATSTTTSTVMEHVTRLFAQQNIHDVPSNKLYELSAEERTAAFQDLHGAFDLVPETPELVQQKHMELNQALLNLPPDETAAIFQAMQLNPAYVESLKLCFLRAEQFRSDRAAVRMAGHFTMRFKLFQNPELLGRDIWLSDLQHEKDKLGLQVGLVQLLKSRDRVGRAIIMMHANAAGTGRPYDQMSILRLLFWFCTLAARLGDDVQRRGIVLIWWGIQPPVSAEMKGRGTNYFNLIFANCPAYASAVHACTDDMRMKRRFDEIAISIKADFLMRFQTHYGSALECQWNLNTFGIPSKILPLETDGKVHLRDHTSFLSQLRKAEIQNRGHHFSQQQYQPSSVSSTHENMESLSLATMLDNSNSSTSSESGRNNGSVEPGPSDVISGRGKRGAKYQGNNLLRDLIEQNFLAHEAGTSQARRLIARSIYISMIQSGSRFLNYTNDEEGWSELNEDAAIVKILHGFRNHRLKINKLSR